MITETIQIRKLLTEQQKVELLDQIAKANDRQSELQGQIENLKEQTKPLKEAIEREDYNILQALGNYKFGYVCENVECTVIYTDGKTQYISVATGEIVDEHETTEAEQLRLQENRVDAESIIREASKVE